MINYQEITDNLKDEDIFNLLTRLGGEPIDKGDYFLSRTICHHIDEEEASYKLYYYKNTHLFYCYSEDGPMSIFKFLRHYYEVRNIEYDWYHDIFEVVTNCSLVRTGGVSGYRSIRDKYTSAPLKTLEVYPKGILDVFTHYYPVEWLNDNISKTTMDKFNILFSHDQNKIIIPHYNVNSELIGIRGRALDPWEIENLGKYMPVQIEGKWYSHPLSLNLYGLNQTKDAIRQTGYCILVEAEKSVMQAEGFSLPNCCAAVCGSKINKYQIQLLMKTCAPREIIIAFDNEEQPGSDTYFNKLYNMCLKYKNYANFSFIYDTKHRLESKDSPTDKGEEIFQSLLRERVKI